MLKVGFICFVRYEIHVLHVGVRIKFRLINEKTRIREAAIFESTKNIVLQTVCQFLEFLQVLWTWTRSLLHNHWLFPKGVCEWRHWTQHATLQFHRWILTLSSRGQKLKFYRHFHQSSSVMWTFSRCGRHVNEWVVNLRVFLHL